MSRFRHLPFSAVTAALAIAAYGCGLPAMGPALARDGGEVGASARSHREIPLSPGAPKMGQQPRLPRDAGLGDHTAAVNVLYTNDIHSRVDPFPADFYNARYAGKGGFARLAAAIRREKASDPATIAVDSGDYLQGTPYFNFYKGEAEMKLMNAAGFDAITVGNHEFDNGVTGFKKVMPHFHGSLITTNLTFGEGIGQRYAVKKVGAVRVGMFALITEVNGLVAASAFKGAKYYDPILSARAAVAKLRDEADVIVMLSHVGTKLNHGAGNAEADGHEAAPLSDEDIASAVPGIDVIISGHTHIQVDPPKVVGKTHIVSTGMGGAYLGKVRLTLAGGQVAGVQNTLIPMDQQVPQDRGVEAIIAPYRAPMVRTLNTVIGEATAVFDKYRPENAECGVNNLVADAMLYGARKVDAGVDFAVASSGTPRAAINAGPITMEDVFYALPFDNEIVIQEVSGKTAIEMLTLQRRPNDHVRHAVANATYVLTRNAGPIADVRIGGQPLDPARTYKVAVNDYMSEGSSGFSMLTSAPKRPTKVLQRDALVELIKSSKRLGPAVGRIKTAS